MVYSRLCTRGYYPVKWNKKFSYPKSVRSLINDARHYDVGDEKLPSVTTILAATQSDEKRESLAKWIAKKGKTEADCVKNEAAKRGTAMHSICLLYTSPSPRDGLLSRMPSSA